MTSPTCPHGISLDLFCTTLHLPDGAKPTGAVCGHGISVDKFCRHLHGEMPVTDIASVEVEVA